MSRFSTLLSIVLAASVVSSPGASAQGWSNLGGNAARNGLIDTVGPVDPDLAWSNTEDFSIISWAPFVEGDTVYTVRESAFPTTGGSAGDEIVAYALEDGTVRWRTVVPFGGDTATEWIAWIAGVRDGRVFAARSSNSRATPLHAFDAATGDFLWTSDATTTAFAYDGVVFTPEGDLIVGDFGTLARIDAATGATEWTASFLCPVSGSCGVAASDTALYVDEAAPNFTNQITKFDLATGARLYSSPAVNGFTTQNTPFLSEDGCTVFFARSQNSVTTDFLYSWKDDGAALVPQWNVPVRWTTRHEHGIGPDGTVYTFTQANELVGLDPDTGLERYDAGVLSPPGTTDNLSPMTAVDARGTVYVCNGFASNPVTDGRLWAYSADLSTQLFELVLDRPNQGGPALAADGTLVIVDRNGVYAYRCAAPASAVVRNAGANPASTSTDLPVLGASFQATVDLGGTTGHPTAAYVGFLTPTNLPLPGGQVLLVDVTDPAGELLGLAASSGPLAAFSLAVPDAPELCGLAVSTQALHFGGGLPFALSNAVDLVLGR